MDKLKPCPFCGGEATIESFQVRKGFEAVIQCCGCLVNMPTITYDDEETAKENSVKAWNRRTEEGAQK